MALPALRARLGSGLVCPAALGPGPGRWGILGSSRGKISCEMKRLKKNRSSVSRRELHLNYTNSKALRGSPRANWPGRGRLRTRYVADYGGTTYWWRNHSSSFGRLRAVLHDSPINIGIDGLFDRDAHVIDKVAHLFFNVLLGDAFLLGRDQTFFCAKARF